MCTSYAKDTGAFIKMIKNIPTLEKKDIVGSLDATPLYTNILNNEGIAVMKETLDEKGKNHRKPSNDTLCTLLKVVLKHNNFQYNGNNFLHKGRTAMGTALAPSYANLFMSDLVHKISQ